MNLEDLKLVDVERLEVKPGEALLFKYRGRLSDSAAEHIRAVAEEAFKDLKIPILVLDESIEPIVVSNVEPIVVANG